MIIKAELELNAGQPMVIVELLTNKDLYLRLGPHGARMELEQVQTLILTLQAAEVRMRSWQPTSPRFP